MTISVRLRYYLNENNMNFMNVWRNSHIYFKFKRKIAMSCSTYDINTSKTGKCSSVTSTSDKIERDCKLLPRVIDESKESVNSKKTNNEDKTNSDGYSYSYSYPTKPSRIKIMLLDNIITKMKQKFDSKNDVRADNENIIKKSKTSGNIYVETTRDKGDTKNKEDTSLINENISSESNASSVMSIKQASNVPIYNAIYFNIIYFPVYNAEKKISLVQDKKKIVISSKDYLETLHYPTINTILSVTKSTAFQHMSQAEKLKLVIKVKNREGLQQLLDKRRQEKYSYISSIQNILNGKNIGVPDNVKLAINSISYVLNKLEDVTAVSSGVSHKYLLYRGSVGCIATYRGKSYIIYWDSCWESIYSLSCLYSALIRLAAIIGAVNYSRDYPISINQGLLVVGYTNGKPAEVYELTNSDLVKNWYKWLSKLKEYYTFTSKKLNNP